MSDIKERLRRFAKFMSMGEDALVVVALAEIERLEAENKRLDEMAARAVECFNNASEAALQVFAERDALRTRNERMEAALREAHLCFEAAVTEGLHDAIAESADERLLDLLRRRVLWAHGVLGAALSTSQPVETAEERNERRAFALYHHEHGECAADIARAEWAEETDAVQNEYRDMARAIAESDKARQS